ncbi:MAG: type II toxin-antitoxin system VapC family toxin [Rhizobiaceae bacterium]|nr:type II toxin-antitoxin system VapC family toxin [Rhizobiaceae bacterium]
MVVDSSFMLSAFMPDEVSDVTETLLGDAVEAGVVVPSHWHCEVANAFNVAIRRKRIAIGDRDGALKEIATFGVEIDPETNDHIWGATLRLADANGLTVYDAAYLELAQRRRVPLLTLDRPLADAARKAGIEVLP